MSDYRFDTEYLDVGDTFEGGPIEQSYFISAVLAAGGEIQIDGNTVTILQLPKKEVLKAKAPVSPVEAVYEAPKEEETPVVEAPKTKPGPKPKTTPVKPVAASKDED